MAENETACLVYLNCLTQWRVNMRGQPIGMDMAGVEATMRMMKVRNKSDVFNRLKIMEAERLKVIAGH